MLEFFTMKLPSASGSNISFQKAPHSQQQYMVHTTTLESQL